MLYALMETFQGTDTYTNVYLAVESSTALSNLKLELFKNSIKCKLKSIDKYNSSYVIKHVFYVLAYDIFWPAMLIYILCISCFEVFPVSCFTTLKCIPLKIDVLK